MTDRAAFAAGRRAQNASPSRAASPAGTGLSPHLAPLAARILRQVDARSASTLGAPAIASLQRMAGNHAMAGAMDAARGCAARESSWADSGQASSTVDPDRTPRAIGADSPEQRLSVQRNMYLANADANIYEDSNDDDDARTAYAYVHQSQRKDPFFIRYDSIDRIRNNAAVRKARDDLSPRKFQAWVDEVPGHADRGDAAASQIVADLGTVFSTDADGVVKQLHVNLGDPNQALILSHIMYIAITDGAQYWNTGGGSRLPRARGYLFINRDTAGNRSTDEVLTLLGLDANDVRNVHTAKAGSEVMPSILQELGAMPSVTNAQHFNLGASDFDVVYGSAVAVSRSAHARVTCAGRGYRDDLSDAIGDLQNLQASFAQLTAVTTDSGWISGTELSTVRRGDGQAAAMGRWNALGAAAYANKQLHTAFPLDLNWEWLHVRGAQIGGVTAGGNLVPGLFVTNSAMIPFENMISAWARAAPHQFEARFEARRHASSAVFADQIALSIRATNHPILGTLTLAPLAVFDPLHGKVIDKVAGELIKRVLDRTHAS